MRHKRQNHRSNFGRTRGHLHAMRRSLINQLLTHERIVTTGSKAKAFRPAAEKIITLARKAHLAVQAAEGQGAEAEAAAQVKRLHYIRLAISRLDKRKLYDRDGDPVLTENRRIRTIIQKLFDDLGPRFADRPGGYTRILKLPKRRIGDAAEVVIWELVEREGDIGPEAEPEPKKKRKRRKKAAASA